MRGFILLLCFVLALHSVRAEALSDADREKILGNLERLRETANSRVDGRFRTASVAFREAIGSDDAAIKLYLSCVEKINFLDQQKKSSEFREWKHKESDILSDAGFRLALRHQLRWLVLTLQAASEKADRNKLAIEAQQIVDSIFVDPAKLKNHEAILNQAVTSSVFAKAYDINDTKVDRWPLSPIQLDQIYDQVLLPPFRSASHLNELRAMWIKRIQQEGAKMELWSENDRRPKDEKKIGMASATHSPAYEKYLAETQPKLQWNMELELFRIGDESGAAARMLAHLEKHLAHPDAREWGKQFEGLLKPAVAAHSTASGAKPH